MTEACGIGSIVMSNQNKTFEGVYYIYDVYRRINNTHIRACWPTFSHCIGFGTSAYRSRPIGRTELAWPITDLTF